MGNYSRVFTFRSIFTETKKTNNKQQISYNEYSDLLQKIQKLYPKAFTQAFSRVVESDEQKNESYGLQALTDLQMLKEKMNEN